MKDKMCRACGGSGTIFHQEWSCVSGVETLYRWVEACIYCKGVGRVRCPTPEEMASFEKLYYEGKNIPLDMIALF